MDEIFLSRHQEFDKFPKAEENAHFERFLEEKDEEI